MLSWVKTRRFICFVNEHVAVWNIALKAQKRNLNRTMEMVVYSQTSRLEICVTNKRVTAQAQGRHLSS